MDEIAKRLAESLELSIRYAMTGLTIAAFVILSIEHPEKLLPGITGSPAMAAFTALAVGAFAFLLYRMFAWTFLDWVFWKAGRSALGLFGGKGCTIHKQIAAFLQWRYSGRIDERLGGYLTYRWSVVHFLIITSVTALIASCLRHDCSLLAKWTCQVRVAALIVLIFSFWQFDYLLRVERELCRKTRTQDVPES